MPKTSKPEATRQAGRSQPGQTRPEGKAQQQQGAGGNFMGPKGDPSEGKRQVGPKAKR